MCDEAIDRGHEPRGTVTALLGRWPREVQGGQLDDLTFVESCYGFWRIAVKPEHAIRRPLDPGAGQIPACSG